MNNIVYSEFENEMKGAYLTYAKKVICDRAVPDIRDGFKPVMRRIIYAMREQGIRSNGKYSKTARIVGDVIGKYHPHGDTAVYEALVRSSKDYVLRTPLVDGQGNFGSIDGDSPAAMRYTEARTTLYTDSMVDELKFDTVEYENNFDDSLTMPTVLPVKLPNLLINGSSGIAVGVTSKLPPHNPLEIIQAVIHVLKNPNASVSELLQYVKGPDFPTGGLASCNDLHGLYNTGKGTITIRSKHHIETDSNKRELIVVTEIPYGLNKTALLESIEKQIVSDKIQGIKDIRDESNKDIRIVITLNKGVNSDKVLKQLFSLTRLQESETYNFLGLNNEGTASVYNLKEIIDEFIKHRTTVNLRRFSNNLRKHISSLAKTEALFFAAMDIDNIIDSIRKSETRAIAAENLERNFKITNVSKHLKFLNKDINIYKNVSEYISGRSGINFKDDTFTFTKSQINTVLDMSLHKLSRSSVKLLTTDIKDLLGMITEMLDYLANDPDKSKLTAFMIKDIEDQIPFFEKDHRRTKMVRSLEIGHVPNVESIDTFLIMTKNNLIKNINSKSVNSQRRGGTGKNVGLGVGDEVYLSLKSNTTETLLFFTDKGKCYSLPCANIALSELTHRGKPIASILPLDRKESVTFITSIDQEAHKNYSMLFITKLGLGKKVAMKDLINIRSNGKKVMDFKEEDTLGSISLCPNKSQVVVFAGNNKALKVNSVDIRRSNLGGFGVKLMNTQDSEVVASVAYNDNMSNMVGTVTSMGYGKVFDLNTIEAKSRGGLGVNVGKKKGVIVSATLVDINNDDLMIVTSKGKLIAIPAKDIRPLSKGSTGSKLISLDEDDSVKQCI